MTGVQTCALPISDSSASQKYVSLDDSEDDYSSEFVNGQTEGTDAPNNTVSYF